MWSSLPSLPASLQALGFVGLVVGGVEVIIPPVCKIPAGPFLMGSDKDRDEFAQALELPQHETSVQAFHLGKYPVTVAEYACAVKAQAVPAPEPLSDIFEEELWLNQLRHMDHPVQLVHWKQACDYCFWLSRLTGVTWRLPTEAEWEKAARGTDGRIYPWGDAEDATRANAGGIGYPFTDDAQRAPPNKTTAVGSYPTGASPYGALDMAGNVWEWTNSLLLPYPYQADDGREDTQASGDRVRRGGSYFDVIWATRTSYRCRVSVQANIFGFRLAYI